MKLIAFIASVLFALSGPTHAGPLPAAVGYQEVTLPTTARSQLRSLFVLYPTADTQAPKWVADNPVFIGHLFVARAQRPRGTYPLVVMSHGYGGNWRNQLWLSKALVAQGYIVAAVNHPGTTTGDRQAELGRELWHRPRHISAAIDHLTQSADWAPHIDTGRIAVIGHSLGGWTAVSVAGGRFDARRLETDCVAHAKLAACEVYRELGAGQDEAARTALNQPLRDPRVRAIVALDLGLARAFDPGSLNALRVPALILSAGPHYAGVPAPLESGYLEQHLPRDTARHINIPDAGHFSFVQRCKPGGAAMLEAEAPGDGMLCQDGQGRARADIHTQSVKLVLAFLNRALSAPVKE